MKIVIATDGSEYARAAVDLVARLPVDKGTEVTLLAVIEWFTPTFTASYPVIGQQVVEAFDKAEQRLHAGLTKVLQTELKRLQSAGFAVDTELRQGHAARQIVEAVERLGADLLVTGSRGLGRVEGLLLGSVTNQLVKHSPCSVLVVKPTEGQLASSQKSPNQRLEILLAFDGSPHAQKAVETLKALRPESRLAISVLAVLPTLSRYALDGTAVGLLDEVREAEKEAAEAAVRTVARELGPVAGQVIAQVEEGDPAGQIVRAARSEHSDIVVLGTQGKNAVQRFLLGGVSNYVLHHAPCSVWLVK